MKVTNLRRTSLELCAVHEAGHSVAAEVLGVAYDGATVDPARCGSYPMAPKPWGETFIIDPRPGWSRLMGSKRQIAQNLAICLYAGRAAELCVLGHEVGGHERDYLQARSVIFWAWHGSTFERLNWATLQCKLLRRADALVRENAAAVCRVAAALEGKYTLTRGDVRELVWETASSP